MDETNVRQRLDEVRAELARLDDERAAVIAILRGYETWLRVHGTSPSVQMPLPLPLRRPEPAAAPVHAEPKTTGPSYRGAVLQALKDAHGEPLHTKEIAARALMLGGKSGAKDPVAITDLVIHSLEKSHPIRKVSPRTWVLDEASADDAPH